MYLLDKQVQDYFPPLPGICWIFIRDEKDIYPVSGGNVLYLLHELVRIALPVSGLPELVLGTEDAGMDAAAR